MAELAEAEMAEAESLTERNEKSNCRFSMERCGRWIRTGGVFHKPS